MPVSSSWTELSLFDKVEPAVNNTLHQLLDCMEQELQQGSGLVFRAILTLDINISKMRLTESDVAKSVSKACDDSLAAQVSHSNFGHNFNFDLSQFYTRKFKDKTNTILDIKNSKDCCFVFTIAAFLYQHKFDTLDKKEDASSYVELIQDNFNIEGIKFPTPFRDITKFVEQNEHLNININIYTVKEDDLELVIPNISHRKNPGEKNVNLLALYPKSEECEKEMKLVDAHFVLINKVENLFSQKDNSGKYRHKTICHLCQTTFTSCESEKFLKHKKFCTNVRAQFQQMPEQNYKLQFDESDFDKQYLNEYLIFYDFECVLRNTQENKTCEKCLTVCKCSEDRKSFSEIHESHVPILYNYHIIDNNNKIVAQKTKYCPKGDAAEKLLEHLFKNQKKFIESMTGDEEQIRLTEEQKKLILKKQNNRCRHCRKKCSFQKDDLVLDHSHYNGEIHGISHNLWYGSFFSKLFTFFNTEKLT